MKFVYILNDIVHEIIDEIDPNFPNIPIEQRYSKEFLKNCVVLEDDKVPEIGHIKKGNKFEKPVEIKVKTLTHQERKEMLLTEISEIDKLIEKEK